MRKKTSLQIFGRRPYVSPAQGNALGNETLVNWIRPNGPPFSLQFGKPLAHWADMVSFFRIPRALPWAWKMIAPSGLPLIAMFLALGIFSATLLAEEVAATPEPAPRQIFVPFSDLHVILEQQPKRVLLGREEYEALVKKAKKQPAEAHAPQPAAVVAAEYDATVQSQRAEISGRLTVDVFDTGLHALPLDLSGVGLKNATLDRKNASIGRDANGRLVLFVEGKGRHALSLDIVAPLETTAARQVLNFRLPRPAAAKLRLTVPGDVEIKGGADVVRRDVDAKAKVTRFELLPHAGDMSILMTLNSHLHRQDFAVVAKSVLIDEVTQAYEKLYATVSLDVLYRAVDHFRFVVPEGFEILEVNSPLLARWDVQKDGARKILGVTLREQTTESVVLKITAIRTPAKLAAWTAPRLEPLDVVGGMTVIGLLVEDRLKVESIAAQRLIPIDVTDLRRALPVFAGASNSGRPALRAVAAWYSPQLDFSLAATFKKPPTELAVNMSLLLVVSDRGQVVLGGVSLLPLVEKRFTFDVAVPAGWQITDVTAASGQALKFERYNESAAGRIRVTVPGGMPAGREFKANFHAERTPSGWLAAWTSQSFDFPAFAVLNATRVEGAVAVDGQDDLKVRPAKLAHLVPLNAAEKPKYGLADVATQLAYRYDDPKYTASLIVERSRPRLTARTFSFVRVEPDTLNCHYELIYAIENAKTRQLAFWLPKDTPATSVSIAALDGLKIKEFSSEEKDGRRRWNVSLVEAARKQVRLAIDFQQPLPKQGAAAGLPGSAHEETPKNTAGQASSGTQGNFELKDYALPLVSADGVAYQSGMAAVEGCAELEVRTSTAARAVDVGELADAEYQPGSRLLGAYGFVGEQPAVKIDVLRHPVRAIYPAIVQRGELFTNLSPDGISQTQARFLLRTKSLYLQVKLPSGAELWSAELDGVPLKPQRQNDCILIDVPASKANAPQTLQLVYAASVRTLGVRGTIDVLAPKLLLRAEQKAGQEKQEKPVAVEVPLADLVWHVRLPNGYDLVNAGGTVSPDPGVLQRPRPAALDVASAIYTLSGGVGNGLLLPGVYCARESASRCATSSVESCGRVAGDGREEKTSEIEYDESRLTPQQKQEWHSKFARRLAESKKPNSAKEEGFVESLNSVETTSIPFKEKKGFVQFGQDAKVWADLTAKRKSVDADARQPRLEKDIAIEKKLSTPVSMRYQNQTLSKVIEDLASRAGINVQVDPKGLADEGVTPDTPVTINLSSDIMLKSALRLVLTPLHLDYAVQNGVLVITSEQAAAKLKEQKVYPVADLVMPAEAEPQAARSGRVKFGVGVNSDAGLVGSGARRDIQRYDMSGSRSLKIDLTQADAASGRVVTFNSFGVTPMLSVTLANRQRVSMLGWGLALLVALIGMSITRRSFRQKTAFVLVVAIIATLIPLATASIEVARLSNMLFYTASLLVPYYLAAGVARRVFGWCRRLCPHCAASATTAAVLFLLMATAAQAQTNAPNPYSAAPVPPPAMSFAPPATSAPTPASTGRPYVIQVVDPAPPIRVPDDAIILPYDPDWKNIARDADRLLLPYNRYVELWNRAYPDKKIEQKTPPAPYALAGATYTTQLEGEEFLLLNGRIEIDVMSDGYVDVPLSLAGGVLGSAEVDGQPARLHVGQVSNLPEQINNLPNAIQQPMAQAANQQPMPQQANQQAMPQQRPNVSGVSLVVSGKGRHKLELSVRLKLVRQGGWRVVQGVLPSAPAATLSIVVPQPKTELRLGLVADRRKYDTIAAGEKIETALGAGGSIQLQWRPAVAEGQIDRSLTAVSNAVLDVQEDGLRLAWQLGLEFRRGQRDRFRIDLPAGYLLEKVEGQNVRGWELQKTERGPAVEVVLLQQAKDYEQFILRLWRADSTDSKATKPTQFDAPQVVVSDAALHTGQLIVRRSPLLDLRTTDRSGVSRTDLPNNDSPIMALVAGRESSLKIRSFEAYTFAAVPFAIKFEAEPTAARTSAAAQTIVKISASERKFETCVRFNAQGRPAYQLRMFLPDDLRVDEVIVPGDFQYAVTRLNNRPLLTVYLAVGRQGETPVVVRGRLLSEVSFQEKLTDVALPRLEIFDVDGRPVDRQEGDVAVAVDPAYDVDAVKLTHCETVLLDQVVRWLDAPQRKITRLGLHYRSGDYAGTLRLTPRKPEVACDTITNVRVTDRALEETILLDFNIQNAGIREFSFLLPAGMADARIKVPMLRQKAINPTAKEPGSPIRVKIELQDEVMGQLRVLVENDRLLKSGSHEAPVPAVQIGRVGRRYVTIENVGRDEIVVDSDKLRSMEQLGTRQKDWARLADILGREMTMAYAVSSDATSPRLAFHAQARATVVTVKAEIGLAETTLAVDADGAYRASQVLNMNNATEQFLEIRLPEGAELWTAYVAGEPVKPVQATAAAGAKTATRDVRIPIIKTAPGQSDYQVVLKYGGKMPTPTALREVNFPLIRSLNIAPERSQVRLYVPEDYRWFDFGGTMRRTDEEADLLAGFINYNSKQIGLAAMAFQQGDKWTRARASANIKVQKGLADSYKNAIATSNASNGALQAELAANSEQWRQTTESLARQEQTPATAAADNRRQLNLAFESQRNGLAKNVVELSDANTYGLAANAPAGGETSSFNGGWLTQNKLTELQPLSGAFLFDTGVVNLKHENLGPRQEANGDRKDRSNRYSVTFQEPRPERFSFHVGLRDVDTKNGYDLAVPQSPSAAQVNGKKSGFAFAGSTSTTVDGKSSGLRKSQSLGRESQSLAMAVTPRIIMQEEEEEKLGVTSDKSKPSNEARYQERAQQQAMQQQQKQYDLAVPQFGGYSNSAPNAASPVPAAKPASGKLRYDPYPNAPAAAPAVNQPMPQAGYLAAGNLKAKGEKPADSDKLIGLGDQKSGRPSGDEASDIFFRKESGKAVDLPAAGLASLDVELPTRGRLFCFTTPRGETEITARCVSNSLIERLTEVGTTILALLALWIVVQWIRHGGLRSFTQPLGSTLLILLGMLSICAGLFPIVGVLAICTGCGLKVKRIR